MGQIQITEEEFEEAAEKSGIEIEDGRIQLPTILETGILFEDWEDNELTSDRDKDVERESLEDLWEPSGFGNPLVRPEWYVPDGWTEPVVSDGELELGNDDDDFVALEIPDETFSEDDLLNETVTWEWFDIQETDDEDNTSFGLFSEQIDEVSNRGRFVHEGYHLAYRANGTGAGLNIVDSDGNNDRIIDLDDVGTGEHEIKITRSPEGEWELFADGVSQGTATDTQFTDPQYLHISSERTDVNAKCGSMRVY